MIFKCPPEGMVWVGVTVTSISANVLTVEGVIDVLMASDPVVMMMVVCLILAMTDESARTIFPSNSPVLPL